MDRRYDFILDRLRFPDRQFRPSGALTGQSASLEQLGHAIRATSAACKTVIIRDLQPVAMLYFGALLKINPVCFEHYLNRDVSYETFDPAVLVFDYPETFFYGDGIHAARERELFKTFTVHTRGTLIKVWMNLYIYSQRVVSAKIYTPSPQSDIQLLLVGSLPNLRRATSHLVKKPSVMWNRLSPSSASSDGLAHLQSILTQDRGISSQEPAANAVVDLVSSKWQTMLCYAQVKTSESKAPLTGDIHLTAEVIQRKHDFEQMQRTMMANLSSARLLPGLKPEIERLRDLHAYQTTIAGWASQLERVASSLQGLLAISESLKASKQASRIQNLTILAFVFIPVSTVSSIYGMNTVEIAQNNSRMWQFGVSASITTIVAICAAWSYQYWSIFHSRATPSMYRSSRKRKVPPVQTAPVSPTWTSFRPVSQVTAANPHTQPPKASTNTISQDDPVVATETNYSNAFTRYVSQRRY